MDRAELLRMDEVKTAVVRLLDNILKANNSFDYWFIIYTQAGIHMIICLLRILVTKSQSYFS